MLHDLPVAALIGCRPAVGNLPRTTKKAASLHKLHHTPMFAPLFLLCTLFDTEFAKALLAENESAWQTLGDDTIPPEQDLATLADMTNRLAQWVPRSFLKEKAATLEGKITFVTKYEERTPLYRCKMILKDGTLADVFTPLIPSAWKQNVPMQERTATFGVYVKTHKGVPVFAASAIQWYPDTWLGNLGFDVASFDQVPVSRVIDLDKHDEETNRLMFKFTEADLEPFYGLLRAVSETPVGYLEEEAKRQHAEAPFGVTDLFNRPHETRGKPILLRGTVKRVVATPVRDSGARSLFGIDHYYQIYLFTDQSQGNPAVVCVRSLPEGMPIGDADDYLEQITVAAVPYKLWIYETSTGPHYAPVLVGRSAVWHPLPARQHLSPEVIRTLSFTLFFTLVLIWLACRWWARRSAFLRKTNRLTQKRYN